MAESESADASEVSLETGSSSPAAPGARSEPGELLYVGFNQDYGCFACGTDTGFSIYNCEPFKETFRRDFANGGIGYVEMLFRCNILALVGGGHNPRFPTNKVMIWDDHQNRCIGELGFRSQVKAVKLRRDRIVVVLEQKIYVYNFADLKLVDHIETMPNPKGLCAVCTFPQNNVLVCPGLQRGHVRVELYDMKKPTTLIPAHEADLAAFGLNSDGTLLATTSVKGTLIRVWDTATGAALQEFRRGADRVAVNSIAFDADSAWLVVSSDKGTIHVFKLSTEVKHRHSHQLDASPQPQHSSVDTDEKEASGISFVKGFLPKYFSSEWSHAKFRVPEAHTVVAFGADRHSIIAVSIEGSFYKATFDPDTPGDCKKASYSKFIKVAADE